MYSFKRYGFTLFFLIVFIQTCPAQTSWVNDSLSVLNERIRIRKQFNNHKDVLQTYFDNSLIANSSLAPSDGDFLKLSEFIRQGIDYALTANDHEYAAIGYIRIAVLLRNRNEPDKALRNALLAISNADKTQSDSIKAIAYIELGECYRKSEPVESSKNFTKALDLALKGKNYSLESKISRRLAVVYITAGDTDEAKRQIYKSVAVNKKIGSGQGLIDDYTQLGRVTDDDRYIDTVISLADSLGLQNNIFNAKQILLNIYAFTHKDPQKALNFINSNRDIKEGILKNGGIEAYHYFLGQVFLAGNIPDSALHYLVLAEPGLFQKYGIGVRQIYLCIGMCYQLKNDWQKAIKFYEKMLSFSKQASDRTEIAEVSDSLSRLYNQTGELQKAYDYKLLATKIKDSIAVLAKGKDLVLLDLVREKKKHDEEVRFASEQLHKKHNLQYLGIAIGICIVLMIFLMLGLFRVSKLTIRIFGFIYFICVFEFIILLIEHSVLHPLTHGDPLKLWGLKIVLIAMLVPVQQFIEHKLIHYVQSRKLLLWRNRIIKDKWWKNKKLGVVPASVERDEINLNKEIIFQPSGGVLNNEPVISVKENTDEAAKPEETLEIKDPKKSGIE